MSSTNLRSSRSGTSETGSRRRQGDPRRTTSSLPTGTDTTARLRDSVAEEEDDAGEDGLFLGFEHRMNTDERRRMRERERAEVEERQSRTRSSSPLAGLPPGRPGTSSTLPVAPITSRYASRSSSQDEPPASKSSVRRTAYSRELEKRDRQRDSRPSRTSDDRSHRSEDTRRYHASESRSSRRADNIDYESRRSTDDQYGKSPRSSRREAERLLPSTGRPDQPLERSPSRPETSRTVYRSKSRDAFGEEEDDRRRRREERYRRERLDTDDDEVRRRREERRHVESRGGGADVEDEERRRRREERRVREERRTVRRTADGRTSVGSADSYRSGDDEPLTLDRDEREKRREERRRHREIDDEKSMRSDRRRREGESERVRGRDSSYRVGGSRAKSTDPDMRTSDFAFEPIAPLSSRNRVFPAVSGDADPPPSLTRLRPDGSDRYTSLRSDSHFRSVEKIDRLAISDHGGPKMRSSQSNLRSSKQQTEATLNREEGGGLISTSPGPSDSSDLESEVESCTVEDDEDEPSNDENEDKWTVRVCLISAVDLPFNVVPNVPLCPILKFGLVRTPEAEVQESQTAFSGTVHLSKTSKSAIAEQIEKVGLLSIPKARVRCTSSKILSKRDNGSMEFHEEMRWDNVTRPNQIALAVELCARAALPPPNMHESPLAKFEAPAPLPPISSLLGDASDVPSGSTGSSLTPPRSFRPGGVGLESGKNGDDYDDIFQRAIGRKSTEDTSRRIASSETNQAVAGAGFGFINRVKQDLEKGTDKDEIGDESIQPTTGIAGMRALWRKGRQQFEIRQAAKRKNSPDEMEAATAAAVVAKFLAGGKDDGSNSVVTPAETSIGDNSEKVPKDHDFVQKRDVFRMSGKSSTDLVPPSGLNPGYGKRTLQQERNIRSGDENVALQIPKKRRKIEMAQDMRIGSLVIPLVQLPLAKALDRHVAARIEQWYQLDATNNYLMPVQNPTRRGLSTASKLAARRNPSVLLEISFSAPDVLDESEDEFEVDSDEEKLVEQVVGGSTEEDTNANVSFSRRASLDMKKLQKASAAAQDAERPVDERKKFDEDPVLEPGVCDFIAVVGAINIGDQSQDNGAKGWVNSNPECAILEQFPPDDTFHAKHGRNVTLQNKSEWFCFPEGCRLWRGAEPPSHMDLNLKRFSASSPGGTASSIAAFDACLNCTTSFSWFVIQSNEKENDFKNTKTYGAVIKFYAPAPAGIDSTQDDFAQGMRTSSDLHQGKRNSSQSKRLWVPLGILMTSNLPIVGTMEAMLLRLCEGLASRTGGSLQSTSYRRIQQIIHQDVANLIVNFQKPIPGVLHCSIPFLTGDRLHLTVPPPTGLPPLPHGASVTSVCRLLGSEGLNVLLAAVLTECKILIHSDEIANLPMVAEVATALIYPFVWALPFLPVLPEAMLEFVEAPLSYFIGIPTCKMCEIDDEVLSEIVVIDLDNGFTSPDYYDGR